MKKATSVLILSAALTLSLSSVALAGQWKQNDTGWWWAEDDGSYPQNTWLWLDGNQDGNSECYYFDSNGYLAVNTTIDGWQVDSNGCWIQNGQVQVSAASPADPAFLALKAATERSQASLEQGIDANYVMNMDMTIYGTPISVSVSGAMKMTNPNNADMKYLMDMNIHMLGETMAMRTFYTNDYLYMDMDGQKMKAYTPLSSAMQEVNQFSMMSMDSMAYIQDVSMADNGNGTTTIYYTTNNAEMNAILENMMNSMESAYPDGSSNVTFQTCKGEMTLDSAGTVIQERVLMDMTASSEGVDMPYHIFMEMNYKNPGQPVTISLPSTEGYEDISQL